VLSHLHAAHLAQCQPAVLWVKLVQHHKSQPALLLTCGLCRLGHEITALAQGVQKCNLPVRACYGQHHPRQPWTSAHINQT
jgi:hypothetical protein